MYLVPYSLVSVCSSIESWCEQGPLVVPGITIVVLGTGHVA